MSAPDQEQQDKENNEDTLMGGQGSSFEDAETLATNKTFSSNPTLGHDSILDHTPTQNTILDATLPMGQGAKQIGEDEHYGIKQSNKEQRFEVFREINRGGMGAILESRDVNLRRDVAMKVILAQDASDHEIRRFVEEAQITGQLEHPSIVPVHELSVDADGKIFYTMKMVHGETLKDILSHIADSKQDTINKYSLSMLLDIFNRVCDAISFAHSKGIIHRDLKPENIMIGDFGEVQVMDWGLAKILGSEEITPETKSTRIQSVRMDNLDQTMDGQILGTPQFMAPEQARGDIDQLCPQTDIYALGAILYQILTLRPPVSGKSVHDLLDKVVKGDITPPTQFNTTTVSRKKEQAKEVKEETRRIAKEREILLKHCPNNVIPYSLSAVCMRAMQNKIEKRYKDVAALQKDIRSYMDGFATEAEGAGAFRQLMLLYKRHRSEFALVGAGLVTAIIMITFFIHNLQQSEASARDAKIKAENATVVAEEQRRHAYEEKQRADIKRLEAQEAKDRARYSLYRMSIREVQRLIEIGHMMEAWNLITEIDEGFRGWEYYYLLNKINNNEYFEFLKPKNASWFMTSSMSLSPDNKLLVSGSWGGSLNITLWDMNTGEHIRTSSIVVLTEGASKGSVHDISYSPNGKLLAMGGIAGDIVISDAEIKQAEGIIKNAHDKQVSCVRFSPNGKMIATSSYDKSVKLWDAQTYRLIKSFNDHAESVFSIGFSPDGSRLLSAGADDNIHVWDIQSGKRLMKLSGHTDDVRLAVYSPDNQYIGSAGFDNVAKLWNAETGELIHSLKGHTDRVEFINFSPNMNQVVTSGGDGLIKLWDIKSGEEVDTKYGNTTGVMSALYTSDGRNLVSGGTSNTIKVWDLSDHNIVSALDRSRGSSFKRAIIDLSKDGRQIANQYNAKVISIYGIDDGKLIKELKSEKPLVALKYFKNNKHLAAGRSDGAVDIWDIQREKIVRKIHKLGMSKIRYMTLSPDDKYLAVCYAERGFLIWDTVTGEVAADWAVDKFNLDLVRFTKNSKGIYFHNGIKGYSGIFDVLTGRELVQFEQKAELWSDILLSPDEQTAVGIITQGEMGVWDVETGSVIDRFEANTLHYTFSPDGSRLFVANFGKDISVWDTQTWEKLLLLDYSARPVSGLFITENGRTLVSHSSVGEVMLHHSDPNSVYPIDPLVEKLKKTARSKKERKQSDGDLVQYRFKAWDYFLGINDQKRDYEKSMQSFKTRIGLLDYSSDVDYYAMRVWLCYKHLERDKEGNDYLQEFVEKHKPEGWGRQILDFMLGKLQDEQLLKLAKHDNQETQKHQLCEAYYYIACTKRFAGDMKSAKSYYQKCLDTQVKEFTEHISAKIEIKDLGK